MTDLATDQARPGLEADIDASVVARIPDIVDMESLVPRRQSHRW